MATKTDIANYALEYIGRKTIANIDTETGREASVCKRFYDLARQAVLRDHKWGFATRSITLASVAIDDFVGWEYAYQYPVDALYASEIYNAADSDPIAYTIESNHDLDGKFILTDQEDAILTYVADTDETHLFDSQFVEALSYKLAAMITVPLKGENQLQQNMAQNYGMAIAKAKASDSNERHVVPNDDSSLLNSRS